MTGIDICHDNVNVGQSWGLNGGWPPPHTRVPTGEGMGGTYMNRKGGDTSARERVADETKFYESKCQKLIILKMDFNKLQQILKRPFK